MPQRQLLTYVRNARDRGETDEQIVSALSQAGWPAEDIRQALGDGAGSSDPVPVSRPATTLINTILVITVVLLLGAGAYLSMRSDGGDGPAPPATPPAATVPPMTTAFPHSSPVPTHHPVVTYCCEYRTRCTQDETMASVYVKNHADFVGSMQKGTCYYTGYANAVDTRYYRDMHCSEEWHAPSACTLPPRVFCCKQQSVFCSEYDAYTPYRKYVLFDENIPRDFLSSDRCKEIADTSVFRDGIYGDANCSAPLDESRACALAVRVSDIPFDTSNSSFSQNLLRNADFREDQNNDTIPDEWVADQRFTRSAQQPLDGWHKGLFSATDDSSFIVSQPIAAVKAGARHRFFGNVLIPKTADSFRFTMSVQWRDGNHAILKTDSLGSFSAPTDGWAFVRTIDLITPSGTTNANFVMDVRSLNGTISVDELVLQEY